MFMNFIMRVRYKFVSYIKLVLFTLFFDRENVQISWTVKFRKRFNYRFANDAEIKIGDNVFFNNDVSLNVLESLRIGNNTMFGENVKVYDHDHVFQDVNKPFSKQGYTKKGITIGSNVWVGANVLILKGVSIGDNSVIAGGAIVTKDVPANSLYMTKITSDIKSIDP